MLSCFCDDGYGEEGFRESGLRDRIYTVTMTEVLMTVTFVTMASEPVDSVTTARMTVTCGRSCCGVAIHGDGGFMTCGFAGYETDLHASARLSAREQVDVVVISNDKCYFASGRKRTSIMDDNYDSEHNQSRHVFIVLCCDR